MAKYRIAWMPGDGVGNDVMEAARIVLDRMKFDAEYVPCDIGWKFWCKEGNALPDRTVNALKKTTCGLFGAITSKPQARPSSGCGSCSISIQTCARAKVTPAIR